MEIPGTRYQVQGGNIIGPDGGTVTQQEFLQKVESKEISLTGDSLRVLGQQFGPDLEKSLMTASGLTVPTTVLSNRMSSTENVMGDIFSLMELLAKVSMDQKKQAYDMKAREADMQVNMLNKSADEALAAARVRMITGVIAGVTSMASGALGAIGGAKALGGNMNELDAKALMDMMGGFGTALESMGKITQASGELGAAGHDWNSKNFEAQARRMDQMASESSNVAETLREMNAKVREVIRDMQAAENQAMGTIIR